MKRTLGLVLGAALVPAIASAQSADPIDPYAQPSTTSAPSTTSTTTVVTPPAQPPAPPPVVVVNPQPQPPRTTIVTQTPETYEVVDIKYTIENTYLAAESRLETKGTIASGGK